MFGAFAFKISKLIENESGITEYGSVKLSFNMCILSPNFPCTTADRQASQSKDA